jgi:hypothetical protein
MGSAQTNLAEDGLPGEQLNAETNHTAEHGQTVIRGFGKGDASETGFDFGIGALHGCIKRNVVPGCYAEISCRP